MKLHKLIRRISAAAVAGALTLSLCAPVLAEAPIDAVHLPQLTRSSADAQNDDGQFRNLGSISFGGQTYDIAAIPNGTISIANQDSLGRDPLTEYDKSYDGNTFTFALKDGRTPLSDATITFNSAYSTNLVFTGSGDSLLGGGVNISGVNNVTIEGGTEMAVSGDLSVSCTGALKITGGSKSAVSGALNVEASGSVEVTGRCSEQLIGSGDITSDGAVTLENEDAFNYSCGSAVSGDLTVNTPGDVRITSFHGRADNYAVKGKLTVENSGSVDVRTKSDASIGNGAEITSNGSVTIDNRSGHCVVGDTKITSGGKVELFSMNRYVVDGDLTITRSKSVRVSASRETVVHGNASIASSGKVMLEDDMGKEVVTGTLTYTPDLRETEYNGYKILDYIDYDLDPVDVTDLTLQQTETLSPYTYTGKAFWLEFVPVKMHTVTVTEGGTASAKGVRNRSIRLYEGLDVAIKPGLIITDPRNCRWFGWKTEGVDFTYNEDFEGTFTMPDNDVTIAPDFRYTVKIGSDDTPLTDAAGNNQYFVPDTTVTLPADLDTNTDPTKKFTGWTLTRWDDGVQITGELLADGSYTFTMPDTSVTAEPQYADLHTVTVEGGTASSDDVIGTVIRAAAGSTVELSAVPDASGLPGQVFSYWEVVYPENVTKKLDFDAAKADTSFTMQDYPVKLIARWTVKVSPPDEDHQLDNVDKDFGVEPIAPADPGSTAGGAIAAVAVGGAAVLGGYEVVTRVMLHSLLPEGAAIPANRGQLALLVWNNAGRPEPVNAPAFADVSDADTAKAAQWCVEQGVMDTKSADAFAPDGWTPKFKVIEVWNKAFPKQ